jgi:sugar-specific transcriptional regulator TrmB
MALDLVPFGFTPTESLVYEVLLTHGPGTGYAVGRAAGLARANAYSALEGLVTKGAARREDGRPRRYRPEPPSVLLARVVDQQSQAVTRLAAALEQVSVPASPTLTEVTSLRGVKQVLMLEFGRARKQVWALLPDDVWLALGPALRRAAGTGVRLHLYADRPVDGAAPAPVDVTPVVIGDRWPGRPLIAAVDLQLALLGAAEAEGDRVAGYLGTAPCLVAAATLVVQGLVGKGA